MKSPLIRRREVLLLTGAAATLGCAPALAQSNHYPNRPITLVVGYPPGGSTDLTARVLAEQLARSLGQPVVVENVGGAGGALGAQRVAQATADGHTLLLGSNNEMAIAGLINPALRYDPLKQFTAVAGGRAQNQGALCNRHGWILLHWRACKNQRTFTASMSKPLPKRKCTLRVTHPWQSLSAWSKTAAAK